MHLRRTIVLAGAALAALLLSHPGLRAAEPKPPPGWTTISSEDIETEWPKLNAVQRVVAINGLIHAGQFELAERLLNGTTFRGGSAVDAQFLKGRLLAAQGQHAEAVDVYRAILAAQPKHETARLELAHALFALKQDSAARHHFNLSLGSISDPQLKSRVHRFIDAMDRRKRWNFSSYMSVVPSTNINQGADVKVVTLNGLPFELDETSRKKSGIGVKAGVAGGYRIALSDKLDLVVGGGADIKRYKDKRYNDHSLTAEIGPRYQFGFGNVALYGTSTRRWYGGSAYAWYHGGRLQTAMRLGDQRIVRGAGSCARKRHETHAYQDGWNCAVQAEYDYFTSSSVFVRLLGGYEIEDVDTEHLSYKSYHVGVGAYRELPWGTTLYGQISYKKYDFDGLYPGAAQGREDRRIDTTINLTKRDWSLYGYAPVLTYTYTVNHSNVGFHEYSAHGINFTVTKNF